jgi:uncharacterized protein
VPWLLRDDEVLAAVEVAESFGSRLKGLLGRDDFEGALLLRPARSVHTLGMRFAIDIAYCDADLTVLRLQTMKRYRVGRPHLHSKCIVEAAAGAFERWHLRVGDQLEVK